MNSQSVPSLSDCVFKEQLLERGIKLADGFFFVDAGIALKAFYPGVEGEGNGFGQFGLPHPGGPSIRIGFCSIPAT
jgi:hypothetical protein